MSTLYDTEEAAVGSHIRVTYKSQAYLVPLSFLLAHPGGHALVLGYVNKDITTAFNGAGHTGMAQKLLEGWIESAPKAYRKKFDGGNRQALTQVQLWQRQQQRASEDSRLPQGATSPLSPQHWWQCFATAFAISSLALAIKLQKKSTESS